MCLGSESCALDRPFFCLLVFDYKNCCRVLAEVPPQTLVIWLSDDNAGKRGCQGGDGRSYHVTAQSLPLRMNFMLVS